MRSLGVAPLTPAASAEPSPEGLAVVVVATGGGETMPNYQVEVQVWRDAATPEQAAIDVLQGCRSAGLTADVLETGVRLYPESVGQPLCQECGFPAPALVTSSGRFCDEGCAEAADHAATARCDAEDQAAGYPVSGTLRPSCASPRAAWTIGGSAETQQVWVHMLDQAQEYILDVTRVDGSRVTGRLVSAGNSGVTVVTETADPKAHEMWEGDEVDVALDQIATVYVW